jgi:DNA-binding transcriptional LysR family regulator
VLDIATASNRWELRAGTSRESVRVHARIRSNNALALLDACRAGSGITLLPQVIVAADVAAGRLQRLLPRWNGDVQGVFAIYPGNRFIPAKVRRFVEFVEARLRAFDDASAARTKAKPRR